MKILFNYNRDGVHIVIGSNKVNISFELPIPKLVIEMNWIYCVLTLK